MSIVFLWIIIIMMFPEAVLLSVMSEPHMVHCPFLGIFGTLVSSYLISKLGNAEKKRVLLTLIHGCHQELPSAVKDELVSVVDQAQTTTTSESKNPKHA